jgi:hypothetical protein
MPVQAVQLVEVDRLPVVQSTRLVVVVVFVLMVKGQVERQVPMVHLEVEVEVVRVVAMATSK